MIDTNYKPTILIIDSEGRNARFDISKFKNPVINIGRKHNINDIVISDDFISGEHGSIFWDGYRAFYCDKRSLNGSNIIAPFNKRFLRNTDDKVELADNSVIRIGSANNPNRMAMIWFAYLSDSEALNSVSLTGQDVRVGRNRDNDIVFSHPNISRTHVIFESRPNGYYLVDNNSINGVLVNGKRIQGELLLRDKDIIQILGYQLIYSGNCIYYRDHVSGISINALDVNKIVGKGEKSKQILDSVNLEIKGNEFVAIVGGSGAGKSTVMNVLNGFDKEYYGKVYYNTLPISECFESLKGIIGYVPQEDIIYENLTLRDMLKYAAELKLPADLDDYEINARVDSVLDTIDLKQHQDTLIRKLSGGQKKRANIAVELLADPKVFFLDEPTSGLDPGTEKNLMLALNRLSKEQERTIIMVTHTTQSLHLCDKVIFMGTGGKVCFVGNVEQAKEYFDTDDLTEIYNLISDNTDAWNNKYNRTVGNKISQNIENANSEIHEKKNLVNTFSQTAVITARYIKLMMNDWKKVAIQIATPIVMGLIVWFIADEDFLKTYQGTKSIIFTLSCAAIWIGLFAAIQEICKERSIFKREYMANLRIRSYLSSKVIVLGVMGAIQAILLTSISLGLLTMKYSGDDKIDLIADNTLFANSDGIFLEVLITIWLTIIASMSLGLLISSLFKNGDKATTVAPFILILQLVFSGMLFELDGSKEVISYITFSRWSVDALGKIVNIKELTGYLDGMDKNMFEWSASGLISDWIWLFVMGIVCLLISSITLRNVVNDSR